jgi:hypothetical protein
MLVESGWVSNRDGRAVFIAGKRPAKESPASAKLMNKTKSYF